MMDVATVGVGGESGPGCGLERSRVPKRVDPVSLSEATTTVLLRYPIGALM